MSMAKFTNSIRKSFTNTTFSVPSEHLDSSASLPAVVGQSTASAWSSVPAERLRQSIEMLTVDPHLCRSVPLTTVMRNCGALWGTSIGTASTYELSEAADFFDTFISHNWTVGRFKKWCTLAFHFNFGAASITMVLVCMLASALTALGFLPTARNASGFILGLTSRAVAAPVFFFTLFFGRSITRLFGARSPGVFLDKACIHQEDKDIQREGILKLSAFLGRSNEMLVVYTNIYLLKLWTVYEVGSFLMQHPVKHMKVIPVSLVLVLFGGILLCYYMAIIAPFLYGTNLVTPIIGCSTFTGCFGFMWSTRTWQRDKKMMQERLANFSVRECLCAVEDDRPILYENIAALMRAVAIISPAACIDEALDAYDTMVKTEMRDAFKSAFGWVAYDYHHYLVMSFCVCGSLLLDVLGGLPLDNTPRYHIAGACNWFSFTAVICPATFAFQEYLTSFFLHWTGCKQVIWMLFALFLAVGWVVYWRNWTVSLMDRSPECEGCFHFVVAIGIVSALISMMALVLQKRCQSQAAKQRRNSRLGGTFQVDQKVQQLRNLVHRLETDPKYSSRGSDSEKPPDITEDVTRRVGSAPIPEERSTEEDEDEDEDEDGGYDTGETVYDVDSIFVDHEFDSEAFRDMVSI